MAHYIYDLADEHAPDIPRTIVSGELIAVWNDKISYGTTRFNETGILELDLPGAVIKRLNHDLLRIVPHFQWVGTPGQSDQYLQELVSIEIVQSPAITNDQD